MKAFPILATLLFTASSIFASTDKDLTICDRLRIEIAEGTAARNWTDLKAHLKTVSDSFGPSTEEELDVDIVEIALDTLVKMGKKRIAEKAARRDSEEVNVGPYENLFTTNRLPYRTYVWMTAEVPLILELPKTDSLWSVLSLKGREALMKDLAFRFYSGLFSREGRQKVITANMIKILPLGDDVHGGMAPTLLLAEGKEKKVPIYCQTAVCGEVGTAAELGIPNDCIRLVWGKNIALYPESSGHVWLEYRVSDNSPWYELDVTPPKEHSRALTKSYKQYLTRNVVPGETGSLRLAYPDELKIADDLLTPTTDGKPKPFKPLNP